MHTCSTALPLSQNSRDDVRLAVISESLAGPVTGPVLAGRLRWDGDPDALRGRGRGGVLVCCLVPWQSWMTSTRTIELSRCRRQCRATADDDDDVRRRDLLSLITVVASSSSSSLSQRRPSHDNWRRWNAVAAATAAAPAHIDVRYIDTDKHRTTDIVEL